MSRCNNDVKVKRYPMFLSLVRLHKQPKGLFHMLLFVRLSFTESFFIP